VAATRILSIVGKKNAGKTTLTVAVASEYVRKGRRVMTIKHASHPANVDREGSDTFRHFHEGKAERVLIASPNLRVLFERTADDTDPESLARRYLEGADIVLVEGFSTYPLPKIEVFRREASATPLFDPAAANASEWVAMVTNDDQFEASIPVLRFRDTMWLQLVANIGWDRAKVL
jgi:molybdopterin-guanine dinucleotide biosynthesis adapter protein